MKPADVIVTAIRQYATFKGKTSREDYWIYMAMFFALYVICSLVDLLTGAFVVSTLFALLSAIPTMAITVRRIHDAGKSGWFILVPVYNFILTIMPGKE